MYTHHGNPLRTWIEINRNNLVQNLKTFRKLVGKNVAVAGVIKSNAYGHNIYDVARILEGEGIDMLMVDSPVEALSLRNDGITAPMLVLGYTISSLYPKLAKAGVAVAVSSWESLSALKRYRGLRLAIHVKVDTGMHRQGFQKTEQQKVMHALTTLPKSVRIEGIFTHFAEAKDPKKSARTRAQIAEFAEWKKQCAKVGLKPIFHASATGGTFLYPLAHHDMVRIGIGLYGIWPSRDVKKKIRNITLTPVLSWRAVISEVKIIPKGSGVGYDFTEIVKRKTRMAVIPVGYWHGYPRLLSGKGYVLVHGKRARVLGRVSMDMIVVDVTTIRAVKAGDTITLIGKDGREEISAEEIAQYALTSPYEIVTRLNPLMRRIVV